MKNYERELPCTYREVYRINALEKKVGLILNLAALGIMAVIVLLALIPFFIGLTTLTFDPTMWLISCVLLLISIIAYMFLHELVHGAAYKLLTGEKLTFGLSWSCAYCGVPNIYVYRRTAIIALVAPLTVFTVILVPLTVALSFFNVYFYGVSAIVLALHLGGCIGDMYMTYLLLSKYRDNSILIRDTGPEQFIYAKSGSGDYEQEG